MTLGTVIDDPTILAAILASLTPTDVNVVVTLGPQGDPDAAEVDRARVRPVGFVPLHQLLDGIGLVVSAGGAGTVLGTLSVGLPMVLLPLVADQPRNAARAAAVGAATVVDSPDEVGGAVQKVLGDPSYRAAAAAVAGQTARMTSADDVLRLLLGRVSRARQSTGFATEVGAAPSA